MIPNRPARQTNDPANNTPVLIESLRNATESAKVDTGKKDEDSIPLFWRVFGGTMFSMISLIAITSYNGIMSTLADANATLASLGSELRKDVTRLNEMQGALANKNETNSSLHAVGCNLDEHRENHKELATLHARCDSLLAALKKGEQERRALEVELQEAGEEQANAAERRAVVEALSKLKGRMTAVECGPKAK